MFTKKTENETGAFSQQQSSVKPVTKPLSTPPENLRTAPRKSSSGQAAGKMAPSIIGSDLSITGNVLSRGEIQVDGEIQGDIHCSSLIVGDNAKITGGVAAEDVVVRGKVIGSVRGLRVTLQTTSYVEGDIFHQSIAIEQGAYFEGKSRHSEDPLAGAANLEIPPASNGKHKPEPTLTLDIDDLASNP